MPSGQRAAVGKRATVASYPGARVACMDRAAAGTPLRMIDALSRAGLRSSYAHVFSLGAVGLCAGLWIRAKTVDQGARGNAERRALFVGLWPPMFWLIGDGVQQHERPAPRFLRR